MTSKRSQPELKPKPLDAAVVLAVVLLALAHSALSGIYSAMLYRYATAGDAPAGFDGALLRDAFAQKA